MKYFDAIFDITTRTLMGLVWVMIMVTVTILAIGAGWAAGNGLFHVLNLLETL
jgi:hypothetical protein